MPQERNYEARDHRTEGSRGGARERTSAPRRRSRRPSTGRTAGFVLSLIGLIGGAIFFVACVACVGAIGAADATGAFDDLFSNM